MLCGLAALAVAGTARAEVTNLGPKWAVQQSAAVAATGAEVSRPGFSTAGWLSVSNDDGDAPGTMIAARLQNGWYPDIFYSDNMRRYLGPYEGAFGGEGDPTGDFAQPWWYRTEFAGRPAAGSFTTLVLNGLIPAADVWVNGTLVAGHGETEGAFARYQFDVTALLHGGANALALLIYPNNSRKHLTLDPVDWVRQPPDNNSGVQFPIQLHTTHAVSIQDLHVLQDDAEDFSTAALTVAARLVNHSDEGEAVHFEASVAGRTVAEDVGIDARSSVAVRLSPSDHPQLVLSHPRVWWPYALGAQPLYHLSASASIGGARSDVASEDFGIRTVTSYLTPATEFLPQGGRQFVVNHLPLLIRGGGWAEDLFLRYSRSSAATEIAFMKNLGINAVRTEGTHMPDDWYAQMDRAGVLVLAGWQCCDKWETPIPGVQLSLGPPVEGGTWSDDDYAVAENSTRTQAARLRDHPSVIAFLIGSDDAPIDRQETSYLNGLHAADWSVPVISAAAYASSSQTGWSGMKEGPYDWVPPSYWYDTGHHDPLDLLPLLKLTLQGEAWGFDSETSAGNTIPTLDSLVRFMSPSDLEALWRDPTAEQYHSNGDLNRTLKLLDRAMAARYGPWSSLEQYVEIAQAANYETARAEFEAYIAHADNMDPTPSTGVIHWMLNKGWPSLLWFLYNKDWDQPGAYFGAQEANRPLHVLYRYDDGAVAVANLTGTDASGLTVVARVRDLDGSVRHAASARDVAVMSQHADEVLAPIVPAGTSTTYLLELELWRGGGRIDRNVYWLSQTPDVVDWAHQSGWGAAMASYADLHGLQTLKPARIDVRARTWRSGGRRLTTRVTVTNVPASAGVAFLLRADVRRGTLGGDEDPGDDQVRPILWETNDVTLWPGQSQSLEATYDGSLLGGRAPVVSVAGWNVPRRIVPAPIAAPPPLRRQPAPE